MAGADLLWDQPGTVRLPRDGSGLEYPGMCSAEPGGSEPRPPAPNAGGSVPIPAPSQKIGAK